MFKSIKNIFKSKPSSLLWLLLAIGTSVTAYFNYQNDKLVMAGAGVVIAVACFVRYYRERKNNSGEQ